MATAHRPTGEKERIRSRMVQVLELRKAGAEYRQIAAALKVSPQTVCNDIRRALRELAEQQHACTPEVRTLELARLDELWLAVYPRAKAGDDKAVRSCILIAKRRSELMGLDAPVKTEITGLDGGQIVVKWGGTPPPSGNGHAP